jgi:hypothetical protein
MVPIHLRLRRLPWRRRLEEEESKGTSWAGETERNVPLYCRIGDEGCTVELPPFDLSFFPNNPPGDRIFLIEDNENTAVYHR